MFLSSQQQQTEMQCSEKSIYELKKDKLNCTTYGNLCLISIYEFPWEHKVRLN